MIQILTPIAKQVFQRSNENKASVMFSGTNTNPSEKISITATEAGKTVKVIETSVSGANWSITQEVTGGYYELTVKSDTDTKIIKFGVGEVFAVTGHSFAEGVGSSYVTDERAIIQSNIDGATVNATDFTNPPVYKSIQEYAITDSEYSRTRGIWGQFAENLVKTLNVPVLIYHASWGGTSIRNWADSAKGLNAQGFAGYNSSMDGKGYPYAKLKNILKTLVPKTGIRGVLLMHGENDTGNAQSEIESNYKSVIQIARTDANLPNLPFFVSLSTWHADTESHVLNAQRNVINSVDSVFVGADITTIGADGRISSTDLHLNATGDKKAAELWANVIAKQITDKVKPVTIVIKAGNTILTQETEVKREPFLYGFGILLLLMVLRLFGAKIPFGLMLILGGVTGGVVYTTNPKKELV